MLQKHRLLSPSIEHETILGLWDKVQDATGVKVGTDATADWQEGLMGNKTLVGVYTDSGDLVYALGVTDYLSDFQLEGVLAHELGHYAEPEGDEIAADIWAAKHGYGPQLISALQEMGNVYPGVPGDSDGIHPADDLRIAVIRQNSLDTVGSLR